LKTVAWNLPTRMAWRWSLSGWNLSREIYLPEWPEDDHLVVETCGVKSTYQNGLKMIT